MRVWMLAGLMALSVLAVAPAQACMWKPEEKRMFWRKTPDKLEPGEVVLQLRPIGFVTPLLYDPADPPAKVADDLAEDGEAEAPYTYCYTPAYAYAVTRVIAGEFSGKSIVLDIKVTPWDETFAPGIRRVVVGRVEPAQWFSMSLKDPMKRTFEAPVLVARLPAQREPTPVETASRLAELAAFGGGHLGWKMLTER